MTSRQNGYKIGAVIAGLLVVAAATFWVSRQFFRSAKQPSSRTVGEVVDDLMPSAGHRLQKKFAAAGVSFPPDHVTLVAFKRERKLEVYAGTLASAMQFVCDYPILGASGAEGPKLREGDRQVPEGFYAIELLNPNSKFHLSLRVNYPSARDIARAENEGRDTSNLGSDIMLHGGSSSAGCLAMGDPAIEEIFLLAAKAPLDRIRLIIAPCDLRRHKAELPESAPPWTPQLHSEILQELHLLPKLPDAVIPR